MRISDWSSDVCSSDLRTILAAWAPFQHDGPSVMGGFVLPRRQAAIALPCNFRRLRIDLVQIREHCVDRFAQAVHVKTVEGNAVPLRPRCVVAPPPLGKCQTFAIGPPPRGEQREDAAT